jgi:subfamily B ATP-binding cassette protein HlyB/CyaB
MNELPPADAEPVAVGAVDSGLLALCAIANHYRIPANASDLKRQLALSGGIAAPEDLVRAATLVDLKARIITKLDKRRLGTLPLPAIIHLKDGSFQLFAGRSAGGECRIVNAVTRTARSLLPSELLAEISEVILVQRRRFGKGVDPATFGFRWFLPSLWRYRRPLLHVLVASLFLQIFALLTPLFFQVVVDKVLVHKGHETLLVLVVGLILLGLFDVVLQYLRTYALAHTTNRVDVDVQALPAGDTETAGLRCTASEAG